LLPIPSLHPVRGFLSKFTQGANAEIFAYNSVSTSLSIVAAVTGLFALNDQANRSVDGSAAETFPCHSSASI
jgi:hypothetical protein